MEFSTVEQAAKRLKLSKVRILQFIKSGRLEAKYVGVWLIENDSLSSFQRKKRPNGKHLPKLK